HPPGRPCDRSAPLRTGRQRPSGSGGLKGFLMLDLFAAPGRFFRGNLHTHSNRSDGALPPEEVCRRYREAGYDFLCVSDHFLEQFDFPLTDTSAFRTEGFTTIIGAELHAPQTHLGDLWHILAVGLPGDFERPIAGE